MLCSFLVILALFIFLSQYDKLFSFLIGTSGQAVQLMANYFEVAQNTDFKIYQYHVDFKPYVENIRVKFALVAQAAESVGSKILFDGGILYLNRVLPKEVSYVVILTC